MSLEYGAHTYTHTHIYIHTYITQKNIYIILRSEIKDKIPEKTEICHFFCKLLQYLSDLFSVQLILYMAARALF